MGLVGAEWEQSGVSGVKWEQSGVSGSRVGLAGA